MEKICLNRSTQFELFDGHIIFFNQHCEIQLTERRQIINLKNGLLISRAVLMFSQVNTIVVDSFGNLLHDLMSIPCMLTDLFLLIRRYNFDRVCNLGIQLSVL